MNNKYTVSEESVAQGSSTEQIEYKPDEYFTDEDELAAETKWLRVKNRKKRRRHTLTSPINNKCTIIY